MLYEVITINSLCGGEGVCGKCKVQITRGEAKPTSQSIRFLSREEINSAFVLACQTEVREDLEVWVPPEARLEEEQILTTESMVCYQPPVITSYSIHYTKLYECDWRPA